jgi:hypothetical protein
MGEVVPVNQIRWQRPTLESCRLEDSMDVGDANEVQKKGDGNTLMFAYEVDRVLFRVVVASCFQQGGCGSEEAWRDPDERDI